MRRMTEDLAELIVVLREIVNQLEDFKLRMEGKMNDLGYEISCLSNGTGTEWQ